jgi:type VI secretion system secreted protein VgrG
VNLGSCVPYAVVAGATVTNDGPTKVNGDLALSPGSAVTGFPPGEVIGTQHITDGAAAACMGDLATAITDADSRSADLTLSGELGGMTLAPGVYKSDGEFSITGILYLDGQNDPAAAWVFIMATNLVVNSGAQVVMLNYDNTQGTNVWWSAGSRADIFTTAAMQGTVMAYQSIAAQSGATTGPLMANIGEVTLLSNVVNSYEHFTNATEPVFNPSSQPSSQPSSMPSTLESLELLNGSENDDDEPLSNGTIAGIVIGGVVFIAMVVAVNWYFAAVMGASAGSAPQSASTGMVSAV